MLPKVFDPPLTRSRAETEIEQINQALFAMKQALIKEHGSWSQAERRADMKPYKQLLADRKAYRNLLTVMK